MEKVLQNFVNFIQTSSNQENLNNAIEACYADILESPQNLITYRLLGDLLAHSKFEDKSRRCHQIQTEFQEEIKIEYLLEDHGDYEQELGNLATALFAYQIALYYNNGHISAFYKISSLVVKTKLFLDVDYFRSKVIATLSSDLAKKLYLEIANYQIINGELQAAQRTYVEAFSGKPTILFFAPEGGISPHFSMHCVLSKTLDDLGHSVTIARCPSLFSRCPVLDMHRLSSENLASARQHICSNCISMGSRMIEEYHLPSINMAAFYTEDIIRRHQNALSAISQDLSDFQFEGISFGKLCFLEIALIKKQHDITTIDNATRQYWIELISSSLLSYLIVDLACRVLPISRIVYYDDYSLMIGARLAAKKHSLPAFRTLHTSHRTVDRSRYTIMPSVALECIHKTVSIWSEWSNLALPPELIQEVANDSRTRLLGKSVFVYSPAKTIDISNLFKALNLSDQKKLLVAYTSSVDELVSLRLSADALGVALDPTPQPFKDQIHWLKSLITYVEARDDVQLVIRVHPRTGKNKRESTTSQFLDQMIAEFQSDFQSSQFIWPDNPISSYDLAELADVGLIAWSSIGLEMARLGVPVLAAYRNIEYFPECIEWKSSKEQYFECLDKLLIDKPSLERIRLAYSWYTLRILASSVSLEDLISDPDFSGLPRYTRPQSAQDIEDTLIREKHLIDINLSKLKESQNLNSRNVELQSLIDEIQKTIHFLFTGHIPENKDFHIIFPHDIFNESLNIGSLSSSQIKDLFNVYCKSSFEIEQNFAITFQNISYYFHDNCTYAKKSSMLYRLITICSS